MPVLGRATWYLYRGVKPSRLIEERPNMLWQFTVGVRAKDKVERIVIDAEDALIAPLKVKADRPKADIMYVRRLNRRGDKRHPPHILTQARD
jgi:hypothetical protein